MEGFREDNEYQNMNLVDDDLNTSRKRSYETGLAIRLPSCFIITALYIYILTATIIDLRYIKSNCILRANLNHYETIYTYLIVVAVLTFLGATITIVSLVLRFIPRYTNRVVFSLGLLFIISVTAICMTLLFLSKDLIDQPYLCPISQDPEIIAWVYLALLFFILFVLGLVLYYDNPIKVVNS
jgi:magnesium-transporting ATPase (P-type)